MKGIKKSGTYRTLTTLAACLLTVSMCVAALAISPAQNALAADSLGSGQSGGQPASTSTGTSTAAQTTCAYATTGTNKDNLCWVDFTKLDLAAAQSAPLSFSFKAGTYTVSADLKVNLGAFSDVTVSAPTSPDSPQSAANCGYRRIGCTTYVGPGVNATGILFDGTTFDGDTGGKYKLVGGYSLSNIQVKDSSGQVVKVGYSFAIADTESTDQLEALPEYTAEQYTWTSSSPIDLLESVRSSQSATSAICSPAWGQATVSCTAPTTVQVKSGDEAIGSTDSPTSLSAAYYINSNYRVNKGSYGLAFTKPVNLVVTPSPKPTPKPTPCNRVISETNQARFNSDTWAGSQPLKSKALTGKVSSGCKLVYVNARVVTSKGKVVYTRSINPKATSYDLSAWNSAFAFTKLSIGRYNYQVWAKNTYQPTKKILLQSTGFSIIAKPASTLKQLQPLAVPNPFMRGSGLNISGQVTSNYKLTHVWVKIVSSDGKVFENHDIDPKAKSFDIHKWNSVINFNLLPVGTYHYTVAAADSYPVLKLLERATFRVVHPASTLSLSNPMQLVPQLVRGTGLNVTGVISSNYKLTHVQVKLVSSTGQVFENHSINPGSTSFDTHAWNSVINFNLLPLGSYHYTVGASDGYPVSKLLQSVWFTVVKPPSTLYLSNAMHLLAHLPRGTGLPVTGVVSSNYPLTNVQVKIVSSDGKVFENHSINPRSTSFDTHAWDSVINFNVLPAGSYRYTVGASDTYPVVKLLQSAWFTVDEPAPPYIPDSNNYDVLPGNYVINWGNRIVVEARMLSLDKDRDDAIEKCNDDQPSSGPQFCVGPGYPASYEQARDRTRTDYVHRHIWFLPIPIEQFDYSDRSVLNWGGDCGNFVATVVRSAGADADFPKSGTVGQLSHIVNAKDKWQPIANKGNESNLLPGDIFITDSHTFIYMGNGLAAQASEGTQMPWKKQQMKKAWYNPSLARYTDPKTGKKLYKIYRSVPSMVYFF